MGAAYSQDLRERVIAARDRGMETTPVAEWFGVSASWVRRVMQRVRDHGETTPRARGGATVKKIDLVRLGELVAQQPDATVKQLHERLGVDCSVSAVDMALRRMGLSFKKRQSMRPNRIDPTSRPGVDSGVKISRTRQPND